MAPAPQMQMPQSAPVPPLGYQYASVPQQPVQYQQQQQQQQQQPQQAPIPPQQQQQQQPPKQHFPHQGLNGGWQSDKDVNDRRKDDC